MNDMLNDTQRTWCISFILFKKQFQSQNVNYWMFSIEHDDHEIMVTAGKTVGCWEGPEHGEQRPGELRRSLTRVPRTMSTLWCMGGYLWSHLRGWLINQTQLMSLSEQVMTGDESLAWSWRRTLTQDYRHLVGYFPTVLCWLCKM